jgi:hypothetical protein
MFVSVNSQPIHSAKIFRLNYEQPFCRGLVKITDWIDKANSLELRTGTEPSEAWLLVQDPEDCSGTIVFKAFNASTEVTDTVSFQDFKVKWTKKLVPSHSRDAGVSLVHLVDQRYALAGSLVGSRYNLVESYNASTGAYTYVAATINGSSPWGWADIFSMVWSIPSGKTLSTVSTSFPAYVPQDLDFRFLSRKEALDILCTLTNTVIVPNADGTYTLANRTDGQASISLYDAFLIHNDFYSTSNPGYGAPSSFSLHFRKYEPDNAEVDLYEKISKTPASASVNGKQVALRLPAYKVADETNLTSAQRPSEIATAFKSAADNYLSHFPSQKKTYGKFQKILPTEKIDWVRWEDLGYGPRTLVNTAVDPCWKPLPEDLSLPGAAPGTMLFCTITSAVTSPNNFTVTSTNYRVVYGEETRDSITVINTFAEDFSPGDKITVFKRDTDNNYEPDRASAGTGSQLIHYELVENMTLADTEALAKPVLANGTIDSAADSFYVVDQVQQFMGKAAFTDSIGTKKGYRGYALFLSDSYLGGIPGYRIISQEGPMLHIAVTLSEDYQESPGTTTVTPLEDNDKLRYGNPFRGRYPAADSGTGAFEVYDPRNIAKGAKSGSKWIVAYNEVADQYDFLFPLNAKRYSRIRGKLKGSAVTRSSTTFIIDNVEAVEGDSPAASAATEITINVPPNAKVDIPSGYTEWIYAQWNDQLGTTETNSWDCGDGANHYLHMRGHVGFSTSEFRLLTVEGNTEADMKWLSIAAALKELTGYTHANNQSVLHDSNTDPQWKDDGACP